MPMKGSGRLGAGQHGRWAEKMHRILLISVFRARVVKRAPVVRPLPAGVPIAPYAPGGAQAQALEQYVAEQKVAGILVLQDGRMRLERYALGHNANSRWTSQSVAKSVTS